MIRFKNTDNEYENDEDYADNGYFFNKTAHLEYLKKNLGIINNIIYSYKYTNIYNERSRRNINSSFVIFRDNFIKEIIELYIYFI